MRRSIWKKLGYFFFLVLFTFLILEIILRIYNPFPFRVKYDKIVLPVNQELVINNTINEKLDKKIVNRRNALGFRGPEKPANLDRVLSIVTVGGSSTECHFLSEGKTWPDQLSARLKKKFDPFWLNNAGFDGHSTFGHQILLNDYLVKLRPRFIIFLVGNNEIENDAPSFHDKLNIKGAYPDLKHFIFNNSEVLTLGLNIVRGWRARKVNNTTDRPLQLKGFQPRTFTADEEAKRLKAQDPYLAKYKQRLTALIDTCKSHGIIPIVLTQPNLIGDGIDSVTGADLGKVPVGDEFNGRLLWLVLSRYNQVTINTCREKQTHVIDMASLLPKSSLYFYDNVHYTNEGAAKFAAILSIELEGILASRFPEFYLPLKY
jgi:hypothetical protein